MEDKTREIVAEIKVVGKERFLADIGEEQEAAEKLKATLDEAYETAKRLDELLKELRTA